MRYLAILLVVGLAAPADAEIYRYVDENGAVVYTDQKPSEDAEPVNLPGLTVIDSVAPEPVTGNGNGGEQQRDSERFPDLVITSPQSEENFHGTGNTLPLRVGTRQALRDGDQVFAFIDGQEQGPFQGLAVDLTGINRGTHQVRVEIRDADGRVVGDTRQVTFHMHQNSRQFDNQPLLNQRNATSGGPP